MPMGGQQLAPAVIARFAEWIKAGALFDDKPAVTSGGASSHWSFVSPCVRPFRM
jgi:hypothetical protein